MELFQNDGHLTDEGLQAVLDGTLDELGRLEAAEHLAYCDECLVRYTALLQDDVLMAPPQPLKDKVMKRTQKRTVRFGWKRYPTVAAAACLAVLMFGLGNMALPVLRQPLQQPPAAAQDAPQPEASGPGESLAARIGQGLNQAGEGMRSLVSGLLPQMEPKEPDAPTPKQPRKMPKDEADGQKRDDVFKRPTPDEDKTDE